MVSKLMLNHHLAHIASAYYTSPFDEATIITQDGGGDNENLHGTAKDNDITGFFEVMFAT